MQGEWLRERKFREQLLAALEQPKKHWFIKIINSAAFLWFATLLLVTLGGGFFANYQQCTRDADLLAERHAHLFRELHTRHEAIASLIEISITIEEVRVGIGKLPYTYADLRDRTLFDLNREFQIIHTRIDDSRLPPTRNSIVTTQEFWEFRNLYIGDIPSSVGNDRISSLKNYAKAYFKAFRDRFEARAFDIMEPSCTLKNTLLYTFGNRNVKIVRASTLNLKWQNFLNIENILRRSKIIQPPPTSP